MDNPEIVWVLGHRIRRFTTDASYGMIEVTSLPGVPGPPTHYHKEESEFFLIMEGTLELMIDGTWQSLSAGSSVNLPPHTRHTFINKSDKNVVWVTGWHPKGFENFFRDFGVSAREESGQEKSVAPDLVQSVVRNVQRYGMYLAEEK